MNGFNIKDFASNLNRAGTLQTNKFDVLIYPPGLGAGFAGNIASPAPGNVSDLLTYRAESVRMPGIVLDPTETRRYGVGPRHKFPTNVTFQDISINFLEDGRGSVHKFFYRWMSFIFNFSGSSSSFQFGSITNQPSNSVRYKRDYAVPIEIRVYDNNGRKINSITLLEAYPIALGDVNLSWAENNTLMHIGITFAYTRWIHGNVNIAQLQQPPPFTAPSPRPQTPPSEQQSEAFVQGQELLRQGLY